MKSDIMIQQNPGLRFLTEDQKEELHNAALEILVKTGVEIFNKEAQQLLKSAGAIVENNLVRIPEVMVIKALATVPSRVVMANRDGDRVMFLEGKRSYFGTGSCTPFTIDVKTGERRRATKNDVGNMAKLSDSLENIDFVMSMGLVQCDDPGVGYIHEFDAMVRNTKKPIIVSAQDGENVQKIIEMARLIMGGKDELRKKPLLAVYSEATSPLRHADDALSKLLVCGKNWVPIIHTIGMMGGATAPVTLEGALAQGNAELLSALVIHQLKQSGAPFLYGGTITPIDMRTMAHPYGAPEFHVLSSALTEMSEYYRMPVFSTGGCSDAKRFDEQAAAEATYSLLLAALSGGNLVHDIGYLDSGLTSSLDQIVFSNEIIALIKHILNGITFNDEQLALDVIDNVGPGGNFLIEEHTLNHFRSIYSPELFTRKTYREWEDEGSQSLGDKIKEKVGSIINNYNPAPISEEIAEKLDNLISNFEKNAKR